MSKDKKIEYKKSAYSKKMRGEVKAAMKRKCPKGYIRSGDACVKLPKPKKATPTAKTILGITL